MKQVLASLAVFAVVFTVPASSEEYDIMGVGVQTCGQYAALYRQSPKLVESGYFAWAQGYMSGLNLDSLAHGGIAKNLASKPINEQQSAINVYCDAHPLAQYQKSVLELFYSLLPLPKR